MLEHLEESVIRYHWQMFAFVFMPNHIHLFFQTPLPNLSRGMQRLLSGYANWFAKRHQKPGHLFQGRFRAELIEDDNYFCTVSRYIHLNPTRGKRPLVDHPNDFPWSSYPGYAQRRRQVPWVAYDRIWAAWQGERGGTDPVAGYRKFVLQGLNDRAENPLANAAHGWLLGGHEFVSRMRQQMTEPRFADEVPKAQVLAQLDVDDVLSAVAKYYRVDEALFASRRDSHMARAVAAWLCRRLTQATLRELSIVFGLTRPESVSNLTRRIDGLLDKRSQLKKDVRAIESTLTKTKNKV